MLAAIAAAALTATPFLTEQVAFASHSATGGSGTGGGAGAGPAGAAVGGAGVGGGAAAGGCIALAIINC
jgi:hypothetical protein